MSPAQPEETTPYTQKLREAVVSTSAVREGLPDDDAIPFIEWGSAHADVVARRLAAPGSPPPSEEQVAGMAYTLTRLLTRLNWLVTYRSKKDAAWLARTFAMVNQLSRELHGDEAPTLSDEEIAAWIADQPNRTDRELLQQLVARLTPAAMSSSTAQAPDSVFPPGAPDERTQQQ